MKLIFKIMVLLTIVNSSIAQQEECGIVLLQSQIDYMNETRSIRDQADLDILSGSVTIPLVAHIIRASNGTGGLSTSDLNLSISQMNTAYQIVNFEFELCNINYINNDDYYSNVYYSTSSTSEEYEMAIPNLIFNAVNIFFVPQALNSQGNGVCGWSSFPSYLNDFGKDWTVIDNDCATNGSTLAHELGHYFNLYHTHQCINECELVDRSNCGPNVGDELCDTPADPRLTGCVNSSCIYTCTFTDSNGDAYVPDPTNIMSYSQKECRTFFSPQQIIRIQQSYIVDRSYLTNSCGSSCEVDLVLSGTINADEFRASNSILSTGTIGNNQNVIYNAGNFIDLDYGFEADADNGSVFLGHIEGCGNTNKTNQTFGNTVSKFSNYTISQSSKSIKEELNLKNTPNPFSKQTTIEFVLEKDQSVTLSVFDVTGKQIAKLFNNELKVKGFHQVIFDGSEWPTGVYYYTLQADTTTTTQKMIVVK